MSTCTPQEVISDLLADEGVKEVLAILTRILDYEVSQGFTAPEQTRNYRRTVNYLEKALHIWEDE